MRIVCISDTHNKHKFIPRLPEGDVLIHAGDITSNGEMYAIKAFAEWMKEQPFKHKIVIAGNHDTNFQNVVKIPHSLAAFKEAGITYLQDEEHTIDGIKFYGSPWQPEFFSWGFNLPRGNALKKVWAKIPDDVNVLITHGPPMGILDKAPRGGGEYEQVGCYDLLERVLELKQLKAHIFGHIHNSSGGEEHDGIQFVNASICDEGYKPLNPVKVIDI